MKNVFKLISTFVITLTLSFAGLTSVSAMTLREGAEAARCDGCPADLFGDTGVFKQVTNTILYIVGIIAVIMLIIGGIYAIIGLVIAFLAFAIVNFVISALPNSETADETSLLIQSTNG